MLRAVTEALDSAGARPDEVERLVHGMTVATNALLEGRGPHGAARHRGLHGHRGARTPGAGGALPALRLPPAAARARGAPGGRTGADGTGGGAPPLDEDALAAALEGLGARGGGGVPARASAIRSTSAASARRSWSAVARRPRVDLARDGGVFREYERCATTVVDAALSPLPAAICAGWERRADAGLPEPEVMLSSGGAADLGRPRRHAAWTVLSGPAGARWAAPGWPRWPAAGGAVGLDMGGTSCDVSLALEGGAAVSRGREVGGRSLALPMVDVHTVGAGGGSIAWRDEGGALRVGPRSAGADPGPACYGRGGQRADRHRRRTCSSGRLDAARRSPAASASTGRRRSERSARWRGELGLARWRPHAGSCGSRTPRWRGRCGW